MSDRRPLPDANGIREIIRSRLAARQADAPALLIRGPIATQRWSRVFRGDGEAYCAAVAIKLCLDPTTDAPSGSEARRHFDALTRANELLGGSADCAAARALDVFDEEGLIVAEWVEGPTLAARLLDHRLSSADALRHAAWAGRWLAKLHRESARPDRPLDADLLLGNVDRAIAGVELDTVTSNAVTLLRQSAADLYGAPIAWASSHGDCKAENFIVSGSRLVAIDIELRHEDAVTNDLAQFLNHLRFLFFHPRGIYRLSRAGAYERAFLDGYAENGGAIPAVALAWARLQNAVRLTTRHREWSRRGPAAWIGGWSFKRVVAGLTHELARAAASQPAPVYG
jgi:tRNA A-37 threonylcarbamoyl transferase component Bud32